MPDSNDFFELGLDIFFRCLGWGPAKKYFTFEVDMMFGAVLRLFFNLYAIFSLELFESVPTIIIFWVNALIQGVFLSSEAVYIFGGKSDTQTRELWYKVFCLINDPYQLLLLYVQDGEVLVNLLTERKLTWSGIYQAFLAFLLVLDALQLLKLYFISKNWFSCCCSNNNLDYTTKGQAEHYVKFHLIGGITGIILVLIVCLRTSIFDSNHKNGKFSIAVFSSIGSEALIMLRCIYQLCKERKKERFVVSDISATRKQIRTKKWYCIITGFTYGLFEVWIAVFILYIYIFGCWWRKTEWFLIGDIIDYEIVDQSNQQQEELNTITN